MSINAERSKAIRERIKNELGYTSKQVSVRSSNCGYSDETRITVKDLSCDFEAIQKIAMSFEKVDYDQYNGEILSGGNTYIFVAYDWGILHQAEEKEIENAEKAINEAELKMLNVIRLFTLTSRAVNMSLFLAGLKNQQEDICLLILRKMKNVEKI